MPALPPLAPVQPRGRSGGSGDLHDPWTVSFFLSYSLPNDNVIKRTHFRTYARDRRDVSMLVLLMVGRHRPSAPLARVKVDIHRYGRQLMDPGNLDSISKLLLDVLQPASKRHPDGLGIVANDDTESLALKVTQERRMRGPIGALVTITELPA